MPAEVPPALVAALVTPVAVELPLPVVADPEAAAVPLGPIVVVVSPELPLSPDSAPARLASTPTPVPGTKERRWDSHEPHTSAGPICNDTIEHQALPTCPAITRSKHQCVLISRIKGGGEEQDDRMSSDVVCGGVGGGRAIKSGCVGAERRRGDSVNQDGRAWWCQ